MNWIEKAQEFSWVGIVAFICWLAGVRDGQLATIVIVVACFFAAIECLNFIARKLNERRNKPERLRAVGR